MKERYADPYITGVGIGLVLLASFVLTGRGLGASGAFNSAAAAVAHGVSVKAGSNDAFAPYISEGFTREWLVWEIAGVVIGAFVSALLARRLAIKLERGPRAQDRTRIIAALAGGTLMGVGARFARGCTSGQALTGGALLSIGSWIFIITCFAAAFAIAPLMRRQWL